LIGEGAKLPRRPVREMWEELAMVKVPILLVRGSAVGGYALQIADGYHRVCASYLTDENTDIPCHLTSWQ